VAEWNSVIGTDWDSLLRHEFEKPYWAALQAYVAGERLRNNVYPPHDAVFAALQLTPLAETKVVILGQDPYHGAGQAHGLAFSVPCGVKIPPSLRNIYKELNNDLGVPVPNHGNLKAWARRGVLLLNTTLTVLAGTARTHRGQGWETFIDEVIWVVDAKADPVVFMLWGDDARKKKKLIKSRHKVIESSHPSPQSARRGYPPFLGSKPFSQANEALRSWRLDDIDWTLPDCPPPD